MAADGSERRRDDRDPTTRSHLGSEIGATIGDDRDACHAWKPETEESINCAVVHISADMVGLRVARVLSKPEALGSRIGVSARAVSEA